MIRAARVLAVILFCVPARAQIVRLPAEHLAVVSPATSVSRLSSAALPTTAILPVAGTMSLAATMPPSTPEEIRAETERGLSASAEDPRNTSAVGAAASAADSPTSPPGFIHNVFDGTARVTTRSGAVYVPSMSGSCRKLLGGFAFVLAQPSPRARIRSIPKPRGLRGAGLLARAAEIAARGHRYNFYSAASEFLFSVADNHTLNGIRGVTDAYSGVFIPGASGEKLDYAEAENAERAGLSRAQTMTIEHVFPQSFFGGKIPMRSDLHILMATLENTNNLRGNLPFGVAPRARINDAGAKRGIGVFDPPNFSKGRVARAMLYFYARYHREKFFKNQHAARFWNGQIETLLDWNRRFPPTLEERRRNDLVAAFQGNRNPFVDDPRLADEIGKDAWRAPFWTAEAPALSEAPQKNVLRKKSSDFHRPRMSDRSRG